MMPDLELIKSRIKRLGVLVVRLEEDAMDIDHFNHQVYVVSKRLNIEIQTMINSEV